MAARLSVSCMHASLIVCELRAILAGLKHKILSRINHPEPSLRHEINQYFCFGAILDPRASSASPGIECSRV